MHDNDDNARTRTGSRVPHHWRKPRSILVSAMPQDPVLWKPGDPLIPHIDLQGMWMTMAGIEAGARLRVEMSPGLIQLGLTEPVPAQVAVDFRAGWYRWSNPAAAGRR